LEKLKRIVFTVTNDLVYDQRMNRICSTLSDAGYSCLLVGRKRRNSLDTDNKKFEQKRLRCWFEKGKLFYIEYNIRLFMFLLFCPLDAICSIDLDTALPGLAVCRMRSKVHIFDSHELFTEVPEVKDRKRVKQFWEWVQKRVFSRSNCVYTVGKELANYFEERYQRKVMVVRNMPEFRNSEYAPSADRFILYQGALNEGRGLENLIVAMQEINCRLVIAGEGDLSISLRNLTSDLNLNQKVNFLGFVKPTELENLTRTAWLGVNVSENAGKSYYLSLNNKFFDYVHAGLPSLLNPFPEYILLNKQFSVGVITNPVVSDIVKNARLLLEDDNLHKELSENCLKAAKEWNWQKESEVLKDIYNTLLEQK